MLSARACMSWPLFIYCTLSDLKTLSIFSYMSLQRRFASLTAFLYYFSWIWARARDSSNSREASCSSWSSRENRVSLIPSLNRCLICIRACAFWFEILASLEYPCSASLTDRSISRILDPHCIAIGRNLSCISTFCRLISSFNGETQSAWIASEYSHACNALLAQPP